MPTVSAQLEGSDKATQVQHKQVKKYHGICVCTDTTGEKYGTKHTEDEEPCLNKNRTKETGNFQLVFNTVVEINQNIYSITQESWMTKKLDERKQTEDQNNTTSDC